VIRLLVAHGSLDGVTGWKRHSLTYAQDMVMVLLRCSERAVVEQLLAHGINMTLCDFNRFARPTTQHGLRDEEVSLTVRAARTRVDDDPPRRRDADRARGRFHAGRRVTDRRAIRAHYPLLRFETPHPPPVLPPLPSSRSRSHTRTRARSSLLPSSKKRSIDSARARGPQRRKRWPA
jgi:hypothetical protein